MMMRWMWLVVALPLLASCQQEEHASYRPSGRAQPDAALVFGVHPYLSPQDLYAVYGPLLRRLGQQVPGAKFRFEASRDFEDFELKLREARFHFALTNPYQALWSRRQGYRIIAKLRPDSSFTGVIVARTDAGLRAPAALRGKTVSFAAPTALAGTLMPLMFLKDQGLDVGHDLTPLYVGTHYSAILNTYTGNSAAAGVWRHAWDRWCRENPDKAEAMHVLWETPSLPNLGLVARADISPELSAHVVRVLADLDHDPLGQGILGHAGLDGFESATDASFAPVAEFLDRYERLIGLPPALRKWRVS